MSLHGKKERVNGGWFHFSAKEGSYLMKYMGLAAVLVLCAALALGPGAPVIAGSSSVVKTMPFEGQIKSIKVDKCGMQPGSCEGSIILAHAGGSEVELAIKAGTWIKRGDQLVTIDELGVGNYVKTEAVQLPGQRLQRITVLSAP